MLLCNSDVGVQFAHWWEGVTSDLLDFLLDSLADILFNGTQLFRCSPLSFEDHVSADLNRVTGLTDIVDFLLGSVSNAGVRHRMTVVPVCVEFNKQGTVLLHVSTSPLHGFSHCKHILSLNANTRDLVTSCVKLGVVRSSGLAGTHTVVIVFANEDHWQRPKTSHVGSLSNLALVGSTITIKGACEVRLTSILHSKCESSTNGDLGTHDTVTSKVVIFCVVIMHRATFAF